MAKIKTIWGPSKRTVYLDRVVWHFSGVRANGQRSWWRLVFYLDTRRFLARHIRTDDDPKVKELPELERAEESEGRVTDMLRDLLKPEHIADATRLALEYQRKHSR